jgi:hypothetical protein
MKSFKLINTIAGWGAFLLSFIVYLLTLEPSVSFWDCGEFIASAFKLQVGHPPGAPLFMLIGRVVSIFAGNPTKVAYMINAFSAMASAATVMFLYWTIVRLVKKFIPENSSTVQEYLMIAAGLVGALTFAFTDSFWFSAVEAEVYASSSLFTAVVFWAILRWEEVAGEKYSNRWIVLIAYLVGLSIGVHLLNLLAIPAIALIWYFKKYKPTTKGVITTIVVSAAIIAFIMWGIVQGTPNIAQSFEVLFVNSFGLPYNSGLIFFILLVLGAVIGLIIYSQKKKKPILNMSMIALVLIMLGFSTYTVVMIRSKADPPMDENNPENAYMLMKYLNRSQYGSTPLLTGNYYNAPAIGIEPGSPVYYPKNGKYVKAAGQPEYKFDSRFTTFFPRMYSGSENHISGYKMWGEVKGKPVSINGEMEYIPTFGENLRYFFSYQLNHMYFRYFMWNFSGRQNDNQGYGNATDGNWLTGIGFIDKARLGHNGKQPVSMANPETMNRYFMLPFLLGLLGMFYHYRRHKKDFWVVMLLFFMTGIAIVLYLNQTPYQPRERDYAYTGSFYAFAIWIGIGVFGLYQLLESFLKKYTPYVTIALCAFVPVIVLAQNYDDHDRSGRFITRDLAKNYLNTCDKNAVLFTYGDNDTFPLWYVQDVENVRPDVRICNVTLLNGDWYIDQMKRKFYNSDPLPIKMDISKYENDERNSIIIRDDIKRPVELSRALELVLSDDPRTKLRTQGGATYSYIPSKQLKITVDKQKVLASKTVPASMANLIEDSIIINIQGQSISKSDLAILNFISNNNWDRPIYFDLSVLNTSSVKFDNYVQNDGFAFRFIPIKNPGRDPMINTDILYDRLMNQFVWGNLGDKRIFIDENTRNTLDVVQLKNNFYSLASKLIEENKLDKARQVINKLYSIMPVDKYGVSYYDIMVASACYRISETGKGDDLMRKVADTSFEKIKFYNSLGSGYTKSFQREVNREISILKELTRIANYSDRTALIKEINDELSIITGKSAS